jgi:hypothetical protein
MESAATVESVLSVESAGALDTGSPVAALPGSPRGSAPSAPSAAARAPKIASETNGLATVGAGSMSAGGASATASSALGDLADHGAPNGSVGMRDSSSYSLNWSWPKRASMPEPSVAAPSVPAPSASGSLAPTSSGACSVAGSSGVVVSHGSATVGG